MEQGQQTTAPPADNGDTKAQPVAYLHNQADTHVVLDFLGRLVALDCGSRARALQVCEEWNKHFDAEWALVRSTSTVLMEAFWQKLKEEGVTDTQLRNAMASLTTDLTPRG